MNRIANLMAVVLAWMALLECALSHPAGAQSAPVSWWRAEGNADDSVDGNQGIVEPGVTFAPGKEGEAFQFNGMDGGGGVVLGNVSAFDYTQSSSFTIEGWINSFGSTIAPNDSQVIVSLNYDCSKTLQTLSISADGERAFFQVRDANGISAGPLFSFTAPSKNAWHHIAGVRESTGAETTLNLYVDGLLEATAEDPSSGILALPTADVIGRRNLCGTTNTFDGLIDELKVYDRALSPAEIMVAADQTPAGALLSLAADVQSLPLSAGRTNGLVAKLAAAEGSLSRGNRLSACNQSRAFTTEMTGLMRSSQLDAGSGISLINAAQAIRTVLGCP